MKWVPVLKKIVSGDVARPLVDHGPGVVSVATVLPAEGERSPGRNGTAGERAASSAPRCQTAGPAAGATAYAVHRRNSRVDVDLAERSPTNRPTCVR